MSRLSLPYLAPLTVTVDTDTDRVESVVVFAGLAVPDRAGLVLDLGEGRAVSVNAVRAVAGFRVSEGRPWPAWTVLGGVS